MPEPSGCTGSLLEWANVVAGCERDSGSPVAEGEVGRMIELQRGGQVETRALIDHAFPGGMRLRQCRGKGHAGAALPRC